MARKAMILKQQAGNKFSTRRYNRCKICGRPHAYLRDYGVCRICFRELAYKGEIPGQAGNLPHLSGPDRLKNHHEVSCVIQCKTGIRSQREMGPMLRPTFL